MRMVLLLTVYARDALTFMSFLCLNSKMFVAHYTPYTFEHFQLFTLQGDEPVTGIAFDRMPAPDLNMYKYYILATLPG